jgi:hypothetical protein
LRSELPTIGSRAKPRNANQKEPQQRHHALISPTTLSPACVAPSTRQQHDRTTRQATSRRGLPITLVDPFRGEAVIMRKQIALGVLALVSSTLAGCEGNRSASQQFSSGIAISTQAPNGDIHTTLVSPTGKELATMNWLAASGRTHWSGPPLPGRGHTIAVVDRAPTLEQRNELIDRLWRESLTVVRPASAIGTQSVDCNTALGGVFQLFCSGHQGGSSANCTLEGEDCQNCCEDDWEVQHTACLLCV